MKIKHVSSKKRSLSLPKAFPKSPQRVPQRLPKTPQRFPKSASFFLLLSDSCFHPFCKQHQLYSRYSHRASDCLAYLAVSLLSFGVFRIGFFLKKQPKLRAVPYSWNRKKQSFLLFSFARASDFSPHVLPKHIVWVAELSCWTPIRVFFSSDVASRVWPILAASLLIFANVSHFLMMRH